MFLPVTLFMVAVIGTHREHEDVSSTERVLNMCVGPRALLSFPSHRLLSGGLEERLLTLSL